MNEVTLSHDRKWMVIRSGDYKLKAKLKSARPGGFNEVEVTYARDQFKFINGMREGQVNTTFRKGPFFVHVNTGPPRWLMPHVSIKRDGVMIGWLRGLVAVKYAPRRDQ